MRREHLLAKQMERNGLKGRSASQVSDGALDEDHKRLYQRGGSPRDLERRIGEICAQGGARDPTKGKSSTVDVTVRNLEKYLGKEKYTC